MVVLNSVVSCRKKREFELLLHLSVGLPLYNVLRYYSKLVNSIGGITLLYFLNNSLMLLKPAVLESKPYKTTTDSVLAVGKQITKFVASLALFALLHHNTAVLNHGNPRLLLYENFNASKKPRGRSKSGMANH